MIAVLENGKWNKTDEVTPDANGRLVCLLSVNEIHKLDEVQHVDKAVILQCLLRKSFAFEHQGKMDYIGLLFLNMNKPKEAGVNVCVCNEDKVLIFIYENTERANAVIKDMISESHDDDPSNGNLFISFLEKIIAGHIEQHELIEDEIALLENFYLTDRDSVGPGRILELQKKLLEYKRFYEQLQYMLDDVQEAKYNLIEQENIQRYTRFSRRVERLLKNTLVLREYVTQVRESYQAETDISLNKVMRLFTVVTVIFLPLTLLVGWYGMNLKMPEFLWSGSYPIVILISVIIVVATVLTFKMKKWF